eukprot:scaffold142966_cov17-Tisochrysis_lutea.AAC.2
MHAKYRTSKSAHQLLYERLPTRGEFTSCCLGSCQQEGSSPAAAWAAANKRGVYQLLLGQLPTRGEFTSCCLGSCQKDGSSPAAAWPAANKTGVHQQGGCTCARARSPSAVAWAAAMRARSLWGSCLGALHWGHAVATRAAHTCHPILCSPFPDGWDTARVGDMEWAGSVGQLDAGLGQSPVLVLLLLLLGMLSKGGGLQGVRWAGRGGRALQGCRAGNAGSCGIRAGASTIHRSKTAKQAGRGKETAMQIDALPSAMRWRTSSMGAGLVKAARRKGRSTHLLAMRPRQDYLKGGPVKGVAAEVAGCFLPVGGLSESGGGQQQGTQQLLAAAPG